MFSHILASGKVISKAVLLWESSKFLVVIICHMTRFSEIWSACFRLGAHHEPPTTDGGNSFKCQKVPRKRTLPVWSGHLHLRISVLSCKIALAKYWSNNSCFLFFSRTNISLLIDDQLSTSLLFRLLAAAAIKKFLHTFHFTRSTCFKPSPSSSFFLELSPLELDSFSLRGFFPRPVELFSHSSLLLQFQLSNGGKLVAVRPQELLLSFWVNTDIQACNTDATINNMDRRQHRLWWNLIGAGYITPLSSSRRWSVWEEFGFVGGLARLRRRRNCRWLTADGRACSPCRRIVGRHAHHTIG